MNAKQSFYAIAAIVGAVVTWYFNLQVLGNDQGNSFLALAYANAASTSLTNDLLVVVAVFLFWSWFEARRLKMKHWWAYVVLTFGVAIATAYPLFLLMRERALTMETEQ